MSFRFLVLLLVPLFTPTRLAADVVLVKEGKPAARLYVPTPRSEPIEQAVHELHDHLERMTGGKIEVVRSDDVRSIRKPAIVLGTLAAALGAKPGRSSPTREGFRLRVKEDLVLVAGESDLGVRHGVYELLRRLGCDWIMPGTIGEIIPQKKTVSLPELDLTQTPAFTVRRLWYSGGARINTKEEGARFQKWLRRHRGSEGPLPPSAVAGHAWDQLLRRHRAVFERHPDMLALRRMPDGTLRRAGPQLESTHPKVVQLIVEDIRAAFRKNGWAKDREAGFGIGPADGLGFSVSVESQLAGSGRIDPITGDTDVTDLVVKLGNDVLEKIDKEFPNVWLGFYVYSTHADYPLRYKPHPRLSLTFADITYSRYHDFSDLSCRSRAYYREVVERWGKLARAQGNPLYFRGYNWNLAENLVPTTRLKVWGVDLPFYHRQGFRGCNVEAQKMWAINAPHDYLFMRLCWDVTLDWKKVLTEFCQAAYGAGARDMERYYRRLVQTQHEAGQEAGSYHALHLIFPATYLRDAEGDLAAARKACTSHEERTRVGHAELGFAFLKGYLAFHDASTRGDFVQAKREYDQLHVRWEKAHAVNSDLVTKLTPNYLRRFFGNFVHEAAMYSSAPYRVIARLPDEMPTLLDPTGQGERMRYHHPAVNDSRFLRTRTFSMPWDAQGLGGYRSGAVWYRHRFPVPAALKGKPVGLFLGGFDDEARVWLNGKPLGTSGRRFSNPAVFDLTDEIMAEGDNLLAIQIIRNSAANELGTGGLFRPSFLFTGPRLKSKAPKPLEPHRVLPGGGRGAGEK